MEGLGIVTSGTMPAGTQSTCGGDHSTSRLGSRGVRTKRRYAANMVILTRKTLAAIVSNQEWASPGILKHAFTSSLHLYILLQTWKVRASKAWSHSMWQRRESAFAWARTATSFQCGSFCLKQPGDGQLLYPCPAAFSHVFANKQRELGY